ncbi:MAG TPA: hypothetical protein VNS19_11960 [Acidimicrobiales bacterium]|jgi:hypothetical protein|nr:hypothetical protein [Acidimicrobiales bacterium]
MSEENPSGWAIGWAAFAAFMLMLAGAMQFLAGLSALLNDEYFVVGDDYAFKLDVTGWGWIHVVIGIVVFCCGMGVLKGHVLGRTVGVLAASVSLLANFLWLPYQPVWSTVLIAVCVAVIWALTAHGRDITAV